MSRAGLGEWQAANGALTNAPFGGAATGPIPTDRGKRGGKWSLLTDGVGIPLAVAVDGANRTDMKLIATTLDGIDASGASVARGDWGSGVDGVPFYTFTPTDAGSHTFVPIFSYAGSQTITTTDLAQPNRTGASNTVSVANTTVAVDANESAPTATLLADGSSAWAFLSSKGRLYARRNAGSLTDPAWRAPVVAREPGLQTWAVITSPSLVRLGGTLALFHAAIDTTAGSRQVWVTTSTDSGATWGTPVVLSADANWTQRVQAVVSGSTVYVFWSKQVGGASSSVSYRTSTDLTTWTSTQTLSRTIGAMNANTTSNFGITKLASGSWLLGWVAPSAVAESPAAANDPPIRRWAGTHHPH